MADVGEQICQNRRIRKYWEISGQLIKLVPALSPDLRPPPGGPGAGPEISVAHPTICLFAKVQWWKDAGLCRFQNVLMEIHIEFQ